MLETFPREELGLVQTPQAFGKEALIEAHRRAGGTAMDATDDAMLLEAAGYHVAAVEGEARPQARKVLRLLAVSRVPVQ